MDKRLRDVLEGREGNHLLPFLWMHDGHHDELPELVGQIYDSGARAFCVESRPHEGFCTQSWWDDMDVVLSEAEKRGMKVWILDDKHFPLQLKLIHQSSQQHGVLPDQSYQAVQVKNRF